MKPNIFRIATKELSQDAFITWLLQFADEGCHQIDKDLNSCGIEFVKQLIKKQIPGFNEEIKKVEAGRQWRNIDVWAEVNDKYLIIIEDKTNTTHHSNQLACYKDTATVWCSENKYEIPICIYLKTGNESLDSLKHIKGQGFAIFNRLDFINVLQQFKNINNGIFNDFKDYLESLEKLNNEFIDKKIGDWQSHDYAGFFQFLEKSGNILNWHYVNNPNGGFWNALLNWDYWDVYPAYIQLEEGKLCFKVSTDEIDISKMGSRSHVRNTLHHLIIKNAKAKGFIDIRRPDRFGNGKYMTVAIVEKHKWLGTNDTKVEVDTVTNNLENYKQFLKSII